MRSWQRAARIPHLLLVLSALLLAGTGLRAGQAPPPAARTATPQEAATFFETRIRPLLAANCQACHGETATAGLRVDSREGLLRGGETGPAIVPGDPEKSALLKAVQHAEGFPRMPRGRAKLAAADIDALAEWIKGGAVWPSASAAAPAPAVSHERVITAEQRAFWAFRPLATPAPPAVRRGDWPRTDIDRFILARLEQDGLSPVGPADKLTLLRRATFDLTGLPPSPDDVDAFLKDESPDAYEKVVDRLLASPQYGEAWGRIWLDVARYGEDDYRSLDPMGRGFNPYPNAHLYRDWVIRAFNDDLPVRPVRHRAARGRSARRAGAPAAPAGAGVPRPGPVVLRQRRGGDHARRRASRPRRCGHARHARPHGGLRALPRSQVRPDSDQGLLLAGRRLPQHRVPRIPARAQSHRRGSQGARRGAQSEAGDAGRIHQHRRRSNSPARSRSRRRSTCRRRGR